MVHKKADILEYENLKLDPLEQTVYYCDKEIILTNCEFQILYLLLRFRGRVFSKKQIFEQVTEDVEREDYHTIEISISRIRKKIANNSERNDYIITIRGRGYKFRK